MRLTRLWIVAFFVMAGLAMNVSCESQPQFIGFITVVARGEGTTSARVTVESHAHKMVRRQVVIVTPQTSIVKREGGNEKTVNLDSLAVKDWVGGMVRRRREGPYPSEVTARRIKIVERP